MSDFGGGIPLAVPWESDLGHVNDFVCLFVCFLFVGETAS